MIDKNFVITENNVEQYVNNISIWIKKQIEDVRAKGVVIGMSSGIDCSTVARLCQEANINIHLILMPCGDSMDKTKSYEHAMELINRFNFHYHVYNIKPAIDSLTISTEMNSSNIKLAHANIKPRVRMTYLYEYAQINNLLVIGTSNLSERTIGYFTKWGDSACDLNPIANVTKREVYILAKYLKVPDSIINKKPSAELWKDQNDEDEIGITYEKIDNFILKGTTGNEIDDEFIRKKQLRSLHKIEPIPIYNK